MESFVRSDDGLDLWTVVDGDGIPVVFLPGGPGCCDYLGPVASLLGRGVRAIRYDPRGCGRSGQAAAYTVEDSIADLEAIRRRHGAASWVLAGHSWGADLALLYAMAHPQNVRALICLSGGRFFTDREWHEAYHRGRDAGLEPPLDEAYPPNMEVNHQVNAAARAYVRRPSLLREVSQLAVPAVFIYGEHDIRPSWPVEQVAALMPNASFHLLPGASHNLWLTHAEALGHELRQFLAAIREGERGKLAL